MWLRVLVISAALHGPPTGIRAVTLVPSNGPLQTQLATQAAKARSLKLRPVVQLTGPWCPACVQLAREMRDPHLIEAFRGTYLIRLDPNVWNEAIDEAGFYAQTIPMFIPLDSTGHATGWHFGAEDWDDLPDWSPATLAAAFETFFSSLPAT
jgi:hypothetical protein